MDPSSKTKKLFAQPFDHLFESMLYATDGKCAKDLNCLAEKPTCEHVSIESKLKEVTVQHLTENKD